MAYECLDKSPIVTVGQTFVTKFGNIRLIKVYDSGSGQIGVKPIGWTNEVIITTFDSRVETIGPVTVKTNFFTLAGRGAHFWVCGEIEEIDPLRISAITVYKVTDPDMVIADVLVNGEGSGTLSISWGDLGTTTHTINGAGQYYFEKSLPVGTHNICGSIGTTQECATIIISEPDLDPDLGTCPYCTTKELQNLKISEFKPDRQVPAGNQYAITVMIHDISVLYGDYVCLCLHDRDTLDLLYSSGAVKIGANEYLPFQISGQMPDKDLKLKLSVIDDNVWPLSDDCEDFRDFTISVGEYKPPLEDEDYLMYVGLAVIVALGIYMIARR